MTSDYEMARKVTVCHLFIVSFDSLHILCLLITFFIDAIICVHPSTHPSSFMSLSSSVVMYLTYKVPLVFCFQSIMKLK